MQTSKMSGTSYEYLVKLLGNEKAQELDHKLGPADAAFLVAEHQQGNTVWVDLTVSEIVHYALTGDVPARISAPSVG
jgi:hypothetical protein